MGSEMCIRDRTNVTYSQRSYWTEHPHISSIYTLITVNRILSPPQRRVTHGATLMGNQTEHPRLRCWPNKSKGSYRHSSVGRRLGSWHPPLVFRSFHAYASRKVTLSQSDSVESLNPWRAVACLLSSRAVAQICIQAGKGFRTDLNRSFVVVLYVRTLHVTK